MRNNCTFVPEEQRHAHPVIFHSGERPNVAKALAAGEAQSAKCRRMKSFIFDRSFLLSLPHPESVLLLPRDVEVLTGDTPARLGRLRRRAEGARYLRFGRYYLYRLSDVLAWINVHRDMTGTGDAA